MAFKRFNHLNVPDSWERYFTKYPQGMSILEALFEWVSQVDNMVDNQNELNDNVEQFRVEIDAFIGRFDDRLQDEVTTTLQDWQTSGFLDVVISEALQWELDTFKATTEQNFISVNQQLQEKVENTTFEQFELSTNQQLQSIVNVKRFGAKGDGITDDTTAIQDAINSFLVDGGTLYFPQGTYNISSSLNCYRNGRYFKIVGDGKRASVIRATANMPYMIKLWDDDIYTQFNMSDIGFLLDTYADIGIDAYKSSYSSIERCYVRTARHNTICIRLSSWCNRLIDSHMQGDYGYSGNTLGIVPAIGLLVKHNRSTNNLIVEYNVFSQLGTSIKIEGFSNDVHIQKNTFDLVGKVLVATEGMKNTTFKYNYCEACGGQNNSMYNLEPFTYTKGDYTREINSPFVLTENVVMDTQTPISIEIEGNQFADCYKNELVAISGALKFTFVNNDFYNLTLSSSNTVYDNVIKVFGVGVIKGARFYAENKYPAKINNLVVYDNHYGGYYYNSGEVIIDTGHNFSIVAHTSKPKIKAQLGNADITDTTDLIVNAETSLRVNYELGDFDTKHPHKLYVNVEKITGTKIITNVSAKPSINLMYQQNKITANSKSGDIEVQNERTDRQHSEFFTIIKADGDVRIKSIFLIVANKDNRVIQLV